MTEFFLDYGAFLLKTATVVIAIALILAMVAAAASRNRREQKGDISVTYLNDTLDDMRRLLEDSVLDEDALKALRKQEKKADKQSSKEVTERKRVYVLDFEGDIKAHGVEALRQEVTAVLTIARPDDEVVLRLESPGGQVHMYGLAASQLERLKQKNIPLTVCVDKVAASGGYMMACVAGRIIAAPFAVLGSIGVVAELPNFNRVLKRLDVEYDVYTAGEYKRTVSMLGENTEEGIRKFREELHETHILFKALVHRHRPAMNIDALATGEHWYGSTALDKGLIDALGTSDDYLFGLAAHADLYEVRYSLRKTMAERLGLNVDAVLSTSLDRIATRARFDRRI